MERERRVQVQHTRCPYCHDGIEPGQAKEGCKACMAWHHEECWEAHGGCSACGQGQRPRTETGEGECAAASCASAGQRRVGGRSYCLAHAAKQARSSGSIDLILAALLLLPGLTLSVAAFRGAATLPFAVLGLLCLVGFALIWRRGLATLRRARAWRRAAQAGGRPRAEG